MPYIIVKNTVTKEEDTLLLSSAKALPIVSLRLIAVAPEAMAGLIFFSVLTVLIDKSELRLFIKLSRGAPKRRSRRNK